LNSRAEAVQLRSALEMVAPFDKAGIAERSMTREFNGGAQATGCWQTQERGG
jgi:hypothetical protein